MAEWVEIGSDSDETIIYGDPKTIGKSGNIVEMWTLVDHKTRRGGGSEPNMSKKSQYVFDCKEEQCRGLYNILFSENMGKGHLVERKKIEKTVVSNFPNSVG